ncbi:MAG TPA: MFS transporter [Steroidobacteraceae bacterium]
MSPGASQLRESIPRRRWRIAWLLGIGVLVSYLDRVNLSASHGALIVAFGISDVAFGYLSGAYNFTYWLCQLPIGVVLDKFGVRRVGRVGTGLWSVATFAGALAPSLAALFGARFVLGVGEAPTFPASAKAVGQWFPPHERSLPTAMFDSAAKFSSVIGIPLVGFVLLEAGWRWGFAVTGAISLLYFVYFWRVYRDPGEDAGLTAPERRYIGNGRQTADHDDVPGSSLWRLLGERKVLGLALGFGSYNYIFYLLLTWLPSYFAFALHIDLLHSFLYTSVPWLVATVVELIVGGWLVNFLIERGADGSRVRRIVLIGGACCGLGILGAALAHTAAQALVWISLSIGGLSAHAAVGWSLPSLIAGRNDVGKVGGIVNFSNQVSGICAPIITGYLVSALHSYAWVFGVSAIYLTIGICGYVFLLGRIEQPRQRT